MCVEVIMPKKVAFNRLWGGNLVLTENVLMKFDKFKQINSEAPESGGFLIGRSILGAKHIIVDYITLPTKDDTRTRFFFHLDSKKHQSVIKSIWEWSSGAYNYLGHWHTHPEQVPHPSHIDTKDWLRRIKEDFYHLGVIFFLIIGQSEIRAWEGNKHEVRPLEIAYVEN